MDEQQRTGDEGERREAADPGRAVDVAHPAAADDVTAAGSGGRAGTVVYSRKRLLVLGGAVVAGFVAVVAGLKALGGPAATSVTSTVSSALGDLSARFPVRSVERVPDVPAAQWTVKVDGLVERPFAVDRAAWQRLARVEETKDFHCVEGWGVTGVHWAGVAPSVLLDEAGVKPEARYVVVHAQSGEYLSTLPLDLMRAPATLLADTMDGQPLPPEHGGPLRLVVPAQLGYKNVKWVSRLQVTDAVRAGYWESNGYPEDAPVPGG